MKKNVFKNQKNEDNVPVHLNINNLNLWNAEFENYTKYRSQGRAITNNVSGLTSQNITSTEMAVPYVSITRIKYLENLDVFLSTNN